MEIARGDPEIRFPPVLAPDGTVLFDSTAPGDVLVVMSDGSDGALCWAEGNVSSKNPPQRVICKMHAIATSLGARVQGDDGEIYGPDGTVVGANVPGETGGRRGLLDRLLRRA